MLYCASYPTDNNRFLLVRNNDDVSSSVELYLLSRIYFSQMRYKNIIQQFGSAHKLVGPYLVLCHELCFLVIAQ